ncbi:MAG: T9SS type B sorting domain-containing protein [Aureibaculum sp.]
MKNRYFLIILCLFVFKISFAQKEATYWYFGEKAGLNFNSGFPVPALDGSLNTLEGCATISDKKGELLFYTDGTTVWNRMHGEMPSGTTLRGNSSSSQSAIIVPKPGDINIYFIFTVDWSGGENGLNYYTVDMNLDKGLGDVISTNNVPIVTNLLLSPTSEKISAVKVLNENAYWVISINQGRFYVYKVDENGVNKTPIAGNSGFTLIADPRGYLKVSPDGTKIVTANMTSGLFIYDFDSASGIVTNERQLDVIDYFPYGVEFSPLSKKLYISTGDFTIDDIPAIEKLFQFNIDIPSPTANNLNASRIELHSYTNQRAALQLGLDGKIYRAIDGEPFLSVINNPEGNGLAAGYVHGAISLGNRNSGQGLPPFIQSFFEAQIIIQNVCLGDITNFELDSNDNILSIIWDFGDGTPISNERNPSHFYSSPGEYLVTVEVTTSEETKTITQRITIFDVPTTVSNITLQQCDDDQDGISFFNLREIENLISSNTEGLYFSYHLTQADAASESNLIIDLLNFSNANTSKIYLRVENQFGCYSLVEVDLVVTTSSIPEDYMLSYYECDSADFVGDHTNGITQFNFSNATNDILDLFPQDQNLSVSYYENIEDALSEQNLLDPLNHINSGSPFSQQIFVRIDNLDNQACIGIGQHITLNVNPLPEFDLQSEAKLCLNLLPEPLIISAQNPRGDYNYQWSNQNNVPLMNGNFISYDFMESGIYYLTAIDNNNCTRTKKITISNSNIASISNIEIVDDSADNSISISVNGQGDYEYSLDNEEGPYQDHHVFNNVLAGNHTIYIRDINGCGMISEEVSVIGYVRFFTPNGDGYNDNWQVQGVNLQPNSEILIFDRFGKVLAKIDPNSEGWDGRYNGKLMPESDYWFLVKLDDGRTRRGHFSLIRK